MSGTKLEDCPPCRNWSSAPELNETQEPFLNPTDYDDEEFLRYLWREYLHPKEYEWVLIAGYIIVFVVALIGNVLGECRSGQPPRGPPRPCARGCQYPLLPAGMHTKRSLLLGWGYYYYYYYFQQKFSDFRNQDRALEW
ncbi:orexin receptor type 2-like [Ovis aries]|uniref:orexin receptor type 2-like n=1 Tax=Ovis aries TaxID=9940 RepID=UPI0029526241|nr:orexin receptor type 2-like [Ovis aries]